MPAATNEAGGKSGLRSTRGAAPRRASYQAIVMPAMLYTGLTHRRAAHLILAAVFGALWTGTFVTGVFFLSHAAP
jgi:hypothetical protein